MIKLGYREKGLGRLLSNLYPWPFVMDGVQCGSIEGFLQCLKRNIPEEQTEIAALHGFEAYKNGQLGNAWKETQILYWLDVPVERSSRAYHELLCRAYDACLDQNTGFAVALSKTGCEPLTHLGKHDSHDTTLTVSEYLHQMHRLRDRVTQILLTDFEKSLDIEYFKTD